MLDLVRHRPMRRLLALNALFALGWDLHTVFVPIVGAIVVNFAKTWFTTGALAPYWLFALGGLFIAVTLFLPKGIVGPIADGWSALGQRRSSAEAESGISPTDTDGPPRGELKPSAAE